MSWHAGHTPQRLPLCGRAGLPSVGLPANISEEPALEGRRPR